MSNKINIANLDLEQMTALQTMLHLTMDGEEELMCKLSYEITPTSWSTQFPEIMTLKEETEGKTPIKIFTPNHKFHYLTKSYMIQELPSLRVDDKCKDIVQVCWPHNPGHNILKRGDLKMDDENLESFDSIWLDIYSQHYMKIGKENLYDLMIGNVDFLDKWSTFLPFYPLIIPQPFTYCEDFRRALPLFYCSLSRVTQSYKMKDKISDTIRMRVRSDKESDDWMEIDYRYDYMKDGKEDEKLPTPEMWGRYSYISGSELKWKKKNPYQMVWNDIISIDPENKYQLGDVATKNLHCGSPAVAMFWVGENLDASKKNNFSNYTTNVDDFSQGWNPVKEYSLDYRNGKRIPKMKHYHFDAVEPWYMFPSAPREPGYNSFSFAYNTASLNTDVGVVFTGKDASVTLYFGTTDPSKGKVINRRNPDMEVEGEVFVPDEIKNKSVAHREPSNEFGVRIRLKICKMVDFEMGKKMKIISGEDQIGSPMGDRLKNDN